jgi:hypothetical protein
MAGWTWVMFVFMFCYAIPGLIPFLILRNVRSISVVLQLALELASVAGVGGHWKSCGGTNHDWVKIC